MTQLFRLTLSYDSGMTNAINDGPELLMTWVATENGKVLGWGLQQKEKWMQDLAMFYVSPKHRRKGIGTKILNRMKKDGYRRMTVRGWNRESRAFFSTAYYKDK